MQQEEVVPGLQRFRSRSRRWPTAGLGIFDSPGTGHVPPSAFSSPSASRAAFERGTRRRSPCGGRHRRRCWHRRDRSLADPGGIGRSHGPADTRARRAACTPTRGRGGRACCSARSTKMAAAALPPALVVTCWAGAAQLGGISVDRGAARPSVSSSAARSGHGGCIPRPPEVFEADVAEIAQQYARLRHAARCCSPKSVPGCGSNQAQLGPMAVALRRIGHWSGRIVPIWHTTPPR